MRNELPLHEINIPSGVHRDKTPYEAGLHVIDADRIRWYNDRIYSIGGWEEFTAFSGGAFDSITGVPRSLFAWSSNAGFRQLVVGTNTDLLVLENGGWKSIHPTGLDAGQESNVTKAGWGSGAWGGNNDGLETVGATDTGWGESIATIQEFLRQWSISNYGEDLIVNPSGGTLYYWDLSGGSSTAATAIANAPDVCNFSFIFEPVPFVFACGCTNIADEFDPMVVRWSSDDDYESWAPGVSGSTAGEFKFQGGSRLVGALNSKNATLIWSDTNLFMISFINGAQSPFSFDTIGKNCGLVSQKAAVEIEGTAYWMGTTGFFKYDGMLTKIKTPLDTTVFGDKPLSLNRFQKEKVVCGLNSQFNEVWWFYPTNADPENNRYVVYNYKENSWYDGYLPRTTWIDSQLFGNPIAGSPDGRLWNQEFGSDAAGTPLNAYFKTGIFALDEGTEVMYIDRFIPDFNVTGNLSVEITGQKYPNSAEKSVKGPFYFSPIDEQVGFRLRGRTLQLEIRQNEIGGRFDVGMLRLRMKKDGNR